MAERRRSKARYNVNISVPPLAVGAEDLRQFFVALSHLPIEVQRETIKDATEQITSALVALEG